MPVDFREKAGREGGMERGREDQNINKLPSVCAPTGKGIYGLLVYGTLL